MSQVAALAADPSTTLSQKLAGLSNLGLEGKDFEAAKAFVLANQRSANRVEASSPSPGTGSVTMLPPTPTSSSTQPPRPPPQAGQPKQWLAGRLNKGK